MKRSCLKSVVITVSLVIGSLMSACANSGGTEKKGSSPKELASGVLELSPQVEKELRFSENELAVVFAVDKAGKMQAFAMRGSKFVPLKFPMHAENIAHMDTLTTFRTTNPHFCWMSSGTKVCIDFSF